MELPTKKRNGADNEKFVSILIETAQLGLHNMATPIKESLTEERDTDTSVDYHGILKEETGITSFTVQTADSSMKERDDTENRKDTAQLELQVQNVKEPPMEKHSGAEDRVDFDSILKEEVGELGLYQLRTIALLAIGVILMAWASTDYLFTASRIPTRCLIPECESAEEGQQFSPPWILAAVPSSGSTFDSCLRFAANTTAAAAANGTCPTELFDYQTTVPCEQYVYETTDSVVYDFGLACDEWRRTLVGSLRTLGALVGQAACGLLSDRWGRRTALAITALNTAWLGLLRCTAATYTQYLVAHIAEATLGSGGFSCAFILTMELLGPKYREFGSTVMGVFYSLGQASLALIAWSLPQWRLLTLTIYLPQLATIAYYWIVPESMRWLMSKGRHEEAIANLQDMARVNGRELTEKSLKGLEKTAEEEKRKEEELLKLQSSEPWLVLSVWRCRPLLLRCVLAPLWFVSFTFIYYGLTINSVSISGNAYVNFAAVTLAEIPGFSLAFVLMRKIGRKPVVAGGFWVCTLCQIAYLFMPADAYGLRLSVYLVGKGSIALVGTTTYTYTLELFPTSCRHRLFSFCSMMGRVGAIIAPLTPAFGPRLPFVLFGAMGLLAGSLALLLPETLGQRLPDTLDDAAAAASTKTRGIL